jgi:glycosyltransferase involved in cell wall biosynthesis
VATIHHGLPERLLTPRPVRPSYLAFLGRISPEKRVDRAIEIAGRAGLPLKIAAKVDSADQNDFEERIRPLLAWPHVEFISEIGEAEEAGFLSGAHAMLFPIDWPAPFELVMIGAMACGTPVVAFDQGSVPKVLEDGRTGFIADGVEGAVRAVERLLSLSRAAARRRFEERFTARRMASDYLGLYGWLASVARRLAVQDDGRAVVGDPCRPVVETVRSGEPRNREEGRTSRTRGGISGPHGRFDARG